MAALRLATLALSTICALTFSMAVGGHVAAVGKQIDLIAPSPAAPASGPLLVSVSASPASGPITLDTIFSSTTSGGVPPYTYSWVWGDGTPNGSTQNPSHNYTTPGTYSTTLTVTDSASHKATFVKTVL